MHRNVPRRGRTDSTDQHLLGEQERKEPAPHAPEHRLLRCQPRNQATALPVATDVPIVPMSEPGIRAKSRPRNLASCTLDTGQRWIEYEAKVVDCGRRLMVVEEVYRPVFEIVVNHVRSSRKATAACCNVAIQCHRVPRADWSAGDSAVTGLLRAGSSTQRARVDR